MRDETSEASTIRIAAIGDVHASWDQRDVAYFNRSDYDLLLFVGDLASYAPGSALRVARSIAQLEKPALVMPGNHDAITLPQLAAEISDTPHLVTWASGGEERRRQALAAALMPVPLVGYSSHQFCFRGRTLTVVAGRPHSFGGDRLAFRPLMRRAFGVATLEESAARIKRLLDAAQGEVLLLAHNGPAGLGAQRDSIWGCDFRRAAGDFGDPDLAGALAYAEQIGKPVRVVLAGHMHHGLRGGGLRRWSVERDGTRYINAARVPRIFSMVISGRRSLARHHVRILLGPELTEFEERLVPT
jgi:uncharacterized protein (TIGR04168 family)